MGSALKVLHSQAQNLLQIRAAIAFPISVDAVEGFLQGGVVIGKWYGQLGLAGKNHQPDFVCR